MKFEDEEGRENLKIFIKRMKQHSIQILNGVLTNGGSQEFKIQKKSLQD
jgi:hypothetical protein